MELYDDFLQGAQPILILDKLLVDSTERLFQLGDLLDEFVDSIRNVWRNWVGFQFLPEQSDLAPIRCLPGYESTYPYLLQVA